MLVGHPQWQAADIPPKGLKSLALLLHGRNLGAGGPKGGQLGGSQTPTRAPGGSSSGQDRARPVKKRVLSPLHPRFILETTLFSQRPSAASQAGAGLGVPGDGWSQGGSLGEGGTELPQSSYISSDSATVPGPAGGPPGAKPGFSASGRGAERGHLRTVSAHTQHVATLEGQ